MPAKRMGDIMTTGEVAKVTGVNVRKVARWIDTGELPGWRIPGSTDRRVHRDDLRRFMATHNMRVRGPVGAAYDRRVMVVSGESAAWAGGLITRLMTAIGREVEAIDFRRVHSLAGAGVALATWRPDVVVIDQAHFGTVEAAGLAGTAKAELPMAIILAICCEGQAPIVGEGSVCAAAGRNPDGVGDELACKLILMWRGVRE